jgi:cystathionine gamma-synthase
VYYPGLPLNPQHAIAKAQIPGGFAGMLSFTLHRDHDRVKAFIAKLQFGRRAANLGAVETTVGPPATTSHVEVSEPERRALGIPETLVRYSTGIEDVRDLIADLTRALGA